MPNKPLISVIVCHHVGDLLYDFIASVLKSRDVKIEVIIITSDEALALRGIKGCRIIHSTDGPAKKRNIGYSVANGEYLAFFDDDMTVMRETVKFLLEACDKRGIGMVYGKLYNMEHRKRLDEAGSYLTWSGFLWSRAEQNIEDVGQFVVPEYVLAGKSASCIIRADVFREVGGFDESFGILGEETDLSWRVWLSGYKVVFEPSSIGYHAFNTKYKPPAKYYTSSRVQFNGCRNYITMLMKNLEARHLWIVPLHSTIWLIAGLAMIGTGKVRMGANIIRGLGYVIGNIGLIMKKRAIVQEMRKKSDRELFPYIMRSPRMGYYTERLGRYLKIGLHG